MSVSLSLFAGAGQQFFTNNGVPLAGGLLYTYAAGTTTPQASYTSITGATAQANPIVLDSAGRVPYEIWLTDGVTYKFVLMTSASVLIGTYDNIPGQNTFVGDIAFTGDLSVGGDLSVTGNETITGNLAVGGTITGGNITGRILQKVTVNFDTVFITTSGTYVSTGHAASITPSSTANKVLVLLTSTLAQAGTNLNTVLSITRGGTSLSGGGTTSFCNVLSSAGNIYANAAVNYLDSPATISSTTYTVTIASSGTGVYNPVSSMASANRASLTLLELS
jgi:hypothetical protein